MKSDIALLAFITIFASISCTKIFRKKPTQDDTTLSTEIESNTTASQRNDAPTSMGASSKEHTNVASNKVEKSDAVSTQTPSETLSDEQIKQKIEQLAAELKHAKDVNESLQLEQAKIKMRLDETQETITQQREQIALLKKGLMLGIIPDEFKKDVPVTPTEEQKLSAKLLPKSEQGDVSKDISALLAKEHSNYEKGNYGKSIVDYTEILEKNPESVGDGTPVFWIGKSWLQLGEYQRAREFFMRLSRDYPTSPHADRAQIDLAKSEAGLGMRNQAVKRLSDLIKNKPDSDVAEIAKFELDKIKRSL